MEIRDSERVPYFLFYTFARRRKIMKEKNQVVPDEVLSKEFFIKRGCASLSWRSLSIL